jgi:hypothetical protein
MLKKNSFGWTVAAQEAFEALKLAVSRAPVLALPNFSQPFIIECDASGGGIGAVLMQEGRPIAFLSQALKGKAVHMSTYEKELFILVPIYLASPLWFEPTTKASNSYWNRRLAPHSSNGGLLNSLAMTFLWNIKKGWRIGLLMPSPEEILLLRNCLSPCCLCLLLAGSRILRPSIQGILPFICYWSNGTTMSSIPANILSEMGFSCTRTAFSWERPLT